MYQFINTSIEHMNYRLKAGLKMNELIRQAPLKFKNAFHINHSISFGSEYKSLFFWDEIHSTGSGNRILAFNVMEKIRQINFKEKTIIRKNKSMTLDKKELEIEYLKSVVSSFSIEDLAFTSCIVFYGGCSFVKSVAGEEQGGQYVTSVMEFSLGVMLNFSDELKHPEINELIEKSLKKIIKMAPDFSPSHWVLSQFYYSTGKIEAGNIWSKKAYLINPLLAELKFLEMFNGYKKEIRNNKLLISLPDFLKSLKNKPPVGIYKKFNQLKEPLTSKKSSSKILQKYLDAYYLNPLMARSIFENSTQYFISVREFKIALDLIKKLKSIKPEYDFKTIFSNYENEINKMKLASEN